MNKTVFNDVTEGRLLSGYVKAPFDEAKTMLKKSGYRIISLEENARLIMQEGASTNVSAQGNRVKEDIIWVPKKGFYLTKNSMIMENPEEATRCHRKSKLSTYDYEFFLSKKQVEKALENSVYLSCAYDHFYIRACEFGEDEITKFAFGAAAKKYGSFLQEAGMGYIDIQLPANEESKPYARKVLFTYDPGVCFNRPFHDLTGYLEFGMKALDDDVFTRGVRKNPDYEQGLEAKVTE
jgi:hypothetical protein